MCFIYKTEIKIILIMIKEIVIVIIFRVCTALLDDNEFIQKRTIPMLG